MERSRLKKIRLVVFVALSAGIAQSTLAADQAPDFKQQKETLLRDMKALQDNLTACPDAGCVTKLNAKLIDLSKHLLCVGKGGHGGGESCGGGTPPPPPNNGNNSGGGDTNPNPDRR